MIYYKITMSKGQDLVLSEVQLDAVLASKDSIVKINNKENKRYELMNKNHIVQSHFDHEDDNQEFELVDGVYKLRKDITF